MEAVAFAAKDAPDKIKKLNTYDWLADIPGNAEESDMVEVINQNNRKGYFGQATRLNWKKEM